MKHYVHIRILCSIAVIAMLCACRSSYEGRKEVQETNKLLYNDHTSHTSAGSISSKTTTAQEEDSNYYKITYNFDTSKPADPTTGLPPLMGMSIEGKQTNKKGTQDTDVSVQHQDSTSTTSAVSLDSQKTAESENSHNGEVLSGLDQGIYTGLAIGIPLFFIILSLLVYVKLRKKNPSK